MKFEFVTYRWDDSFVGGAELHHRRLAQELTDAGHEVSILTTDGGEIRNFCHWGVLWNTLTAAKDAGFPTKRLPIKAIPRWQLFLMARLVQKQFEKEARETTIGSISQFFNPDYLPEGVFLTHGWHYPEFGEHGPTRWSHPKATLAVHSKVETEIELTIGGYSLGDNTLHFTSSTGLTWSQPIEKGLFTLMPKFKGKGVQFFTFECRGHRPGKEFRTLGVHVSLLNAQFDSKVYKADLGEDLKDRGRNLPMQWQALLLDRCQKRPPFYSWLFDRLRGPIVNIPAKPKDVTRIYCNLPWATVSAVAQGDLAMPLWHIDDEFYYWRHWIDALKRSKFVLANTPHSAADFFPKLGIKAHFVGPPIWQPEKFPAIDEVRDFRREHRVAEDEVLVLTICRKSGEKRYEAIASAVANLSKGGKKIRMIGIGPDQDNRPFEYANCEWLGQRTVDQLQVAYAACDIFSLMSESESFGMVIPEAWHHAKPVVVNRRCGPSASLVEDGVDGLLAIPGADLEEKFARLIDDANLRRSMGESGKQKALRDYVRGAAAGRLLKAMGVNSA